MQRTQQSMFDNLVTNAHNVPEMLRFDRKQHDGKIPNMYHFSNTPAVQTLKLVQISQTPSSSEHKLISTSS